MAYEGIDKKIYESGIHFRPLQEYAMEEYKDLLHIRTKYIMKTKY